MGVTSEILGNAGVPHQIEHNGKTYTLSLIDQRVQGAFEKRLFEKAKTAEIAFGDCVTPEQLDARLNKLRDSYLAGDFSMISPRGLTFMKSMAGIVFMASLLIGCDEREVMGLMLAKTDELKRLIRLIISESFPGVVPSDSLKPEEMTPQELLEANAPK